MKLTQRIGLVYYRTKIRALEWISPRKAAEAAFKLFCTPYTRRKTYNAPEVFNKAEKLSFPLHHHTIHGFRWKATDSNGKRVLIVHGFDSHSYRFEKYIKPLLEHGFEVLAFDAPAHGRSTGKTINAILYRDMLLKLMELYGAADGVMAHSFGGIAIALALEELKGNLPNRLVLIAPATETTSSVKDFCKHLKINVKVQQELENLIEEIGGNPPSWYSVARVIQQVTVPTLWLHDEKDTITPFADVRHVRELDLPYIKFIITKGLGHSLYRDEGVLKHIVNFLAELTKKEFAKDSLSNSCN